MRPSPALYGRIRFTTKEVGRGFYRGTRTGSVGAHTEYGGYIVDWRKVRHFNVPDLKDFYLKPFVTKEMEPTLEYLTDDLGVRYKPKEVDGMAFLRRWKDANPEEYDHIVDHQRNTAIEETPAVEDLIAASEQESPYVQETLKQMAATTSEPGSGSSSSTRS